MASRSSKRLSSGGGGEKRHSIPAPRAGSPSRPPVHRLHHYGPGEGNDASEDDHHHRNDGQLDAGCATPAATRAGRGTAAGRITGVNRSGTQTSTGTGLRTSVSSGSSRLEGSSGSSKRTSGHPSSSSDDIAAGGIVAGPRPPAGETGRRPPQAESEAGSVLLGSNDAPGRTRRSPGCRKCGRIGQGPDQRIPEIEGRIAPQKGVGRHDLAEDALQRLRLGEHGSHRGGQGHSGAAKPSASISAPSMPQAMTPKEKRSLSTPDRRAAIPLHQFRSEVRIEGRTGTPAPACRRVALVPKPSTTARSSAGECVT